MTIFDSIRYPVSDHFGEDWNHIPTKMFEAWLEKMKENSNTNTNTNTNTNHYVIGVALMRKIIAEWEDSA